MTKSTLPGLLCLEGEWDSDKPVSRLSIEPALRLLERSETIQLVHRDVSTEHELWFHLDRWQSAVAFYPFSFLYLGFHGSSREFQVGASVVGLEQLAQKLEGACASSVIYLASCGVLESPEATLREFCKRTGADAVVGYTQQVDWIESAAFELLTLSELTTATSMRRFHTKICRNYGDLATTLGFRVATAKWVSSVD